jgi:purine-nucleoside phosphorylase
MAALLQPKAPFAADAIVVGDPGRALLLAQELLEQPKMCNHARGLWGYSGRTPAGQELTIQSTGVGGPSAAAVLDDLAQQGVRRAVRIGTCRATAERPLGGLLVVGEAIAAPGSAAAFGVDAGEAVAADPLLRRGLERALPAATAARVVSLDSMPAGRFEAPPGVAAIDMQTLGLLARARVRDIACAALLIVFEGVGGAMLPMERLEAIAREAGTGSATALSPSS